MKIEINLLINFLTEKEKSKDLLIIGKEYPFFLINFIKKYLIKKEIVFFTKADQDENIFFDFSENENLNQKKCLNYSFLEKETTDEVFELIKNNKKYYNLIFIQK